MNEENQILIFGAIALGLYLYSKQSKTGTAVGNTTASRSNISQTNPNSNNPNLGVNTNKATTAIGQETQSIINGVKSGVGGISDIFKGIGSGSTSNTPTVKVPSNNPTNNASFDNLDGTKDTNYIPGVTSGYDQNNNATDNQSFDSLDSTGEQTGGWGSATDVQQMTLPDSGD